MPAWRMPPPSTLRARAAAGSVAASITSTEPTGAPRPFDRQMLTVSKGAAYSAALTPVAATALNSRAPSRCILRPCRSQNSRTARMCSSGTTTPPQWLCVCSRHTSRVGAQCTSASVWTYSSIFSRSSVPSGESNTRSCTWLSADAAPCS